MESLPHRILTLFEAIHPLDRVPRAGYVMRGVAEPESVAAHSHFLALLTLLYVRGHPGEYDNEKAVAMALIHDLSEARLMDIPMPFADAHLKEAKAGAEQAVTEDLLDPLSKDYARWHDELTRAETPEARLVRGLDKAQMMLKVWMYEREGRGRLHEFWTNPANFADYGLEPVSALFEAICAAAGRDRPQ